MIEDEPAETTAIALAAFTHRGAVRQNNEDAIALNGKLLIGDMAAPTTLEKDFPVYFLAIADGMGGHAAGELASQTALTVLMERGSTSEVAADWINAIHAANDTLYDLMARRPDSLGLGSTVVGVVLTARQIICFNVGDSRAYRFSSMRLMQITKDDVPLITGHGSGRPSHQITQSLGGHFTRTQIRPHLFSLPSLRSGEAILLCSDGLTDMVPDGDIASTLKKSEEPDRCVTRLFELALRGGAHDNVSIIVARAP